MSSSGIPTFVEAISAAFRGWDALQFAVDQRAGGRQSREIAEWMVGAVADYFKDNEDLMDDEVAELLADIMETELKVEVSDGSDHQMAQFLCKVYGLLHRNRHDDVREEINKLPSYNPALFTVTADDDRDAGLVAVSGVVNGCSDIDTSEDEDEEVEQEKDQQPRELSNDEKMELEGFTLVRRNKKKN